mgnify:CR=1 FL=1
MDPEILAQAAHSRRENVAAPADRPSQRRCARDASSGAWASVRAPQMAVREAEGASGLLVFDGYASVVESPYEMYDYYGPYNEIVSAGAFTTTLNRADLDVPLVLQHQSLRRIARTTNGTLTLTEDDHGLHVLAPQLDPKDHDVAYIAPKLLAGLIDEMSFMFRITRGHWSPDYTEYRIDEVDLHRGDVAIVGYGASPHTTGSGLRDADLLNVLRSLEEPEAREALAALTARLAPAAAPVRSTIPEEAFRPLPYLTPVN